MPTRGLSEPLLSLVHKEVRIWLENVKGFRFHEGENRCFHQQKWIPKAGLAGGLTSKRACFLRFVTAESPLDLTHSLNTIRFGNVSGVLYSKQRSPRTELKALVLKANGTHGPTDAFRVFGLLLPLQIA